MDDRDAFQELVRLTKDNNRMLKAMRRDAFIGGVIKIVIYAVLIFLPIWLYQQIVAPQVDRLVQTAESVQQGVEGVKEASSLENVQGILDLLKGGQ